MKPAKQFVTDMAEQVSMPDVYVDIRELLINGVPSIDEFVRVVERDSMLTIRIMRMAGSRYFGNLHKPKDLYQAISLIGLLQLHDLMLGSLCMRTFAAIPREVFNLKAFWQYSVGCGIAARTIGEHSKIDGHFVFFTLGLLHDIGHAMLFFKDPELSLQSLEKSQIEGKDLAESEHQLFGFDYTDVGAELLQLWQLPPIYQQVALFHRKPEQASPELQPTIEVIRLAHLLCQQTDKLARAELVQHSKDTVSGFKYLPTDFEDIIDADIATHSESVLELLWPGSIEQQNDSVARSLHA